MNVLQLDTDSGLIFMIILAQPTFNKIFDKIFETHLNVALSILHTCYLSFLDEDAYLFFNTINCEN